eukprot:5936141-Pleurochrysis_carterae.AAC.1
MHEYRVRLSGGRLWMSPGVRFERKGGGFCFGGSGRAANLLDALLVAANRGALDARQDDGHLLVAWQQHHANDRARRDLRARETRTPSSKIRQPSVGSAHLAARSLVETMGGRRTGRAAAQSAEQTLTTTEKENHASKEEGKSDASGASNRMVDNENRSKQKQGELRNAGTQGSVDETGCNCTEGEGR